jgi:hypothetical protein
MQKNNLEKIFDFLKVSSNLKKSWLGWKDEYNYPL